jgi:hypothetical protein
MVSILDVLVTPTDEAVLDRCDIDWNKIDPVMFDIADLILEDNSGFELQNQIDDAENFKMAGQPYYQRVNFILGCCRLFWNEDMIRQAVKGFFTEQNSPVGVKSDGNGNYEQDALEMFIARMTKAVMTNDRIFKVCATIFEYYMGKKLWNEPTHDKTLRITIPEDLDYCQLFDDLFAEYTSCWESVAVKSTNLGSLFKLTYHVTLKNPKLEKEFLDALRCRNGNLEIALSNQEVNNEL